MKGKIAFVLGAAVGYVLGTRAGRERYEQIKQGAQTLWNTPPVQKGVAAARGAVEDRVEQLKESALSAGKEAFGAFMRGGSDARSDAATRSNSSGAAPSTATDSTSAESKSTDSKQTDSKQTESKPAESKSAGSGKAGGGKAGSSGKAATASARRGGSGSSKGTAKSTSASKSKSTSTGSAKKAGDA